MSQNQQQEFDLHNPNVVLQKLVVIRQSLRAIDDEITGILTLSVTQLQREQKEAEAKKREEATTKAVETAPIPPEAPSN